MLRLKTSDKGFDQAFKRLVADRRESDEKVARDVQVILSDVRGRGDVALAEMTAKWDGHTLAADADWSITAEACREAFDISANALASRACCRCSNLPFSRRNAYTTSPS